MKSLSDSSPSCLQLGRIYGSKWQECSVRGCFQPFNSSIASLHAPASGLAVIEKSSAY